MSVEYFSKKISLRGDEQIIVIIRHHPITYWKQIGVTVFSILLAFFLMFWLFSLGPIGVALFLAILGTGIFYGSREFYIWYMNVFIVTNQRIIDMDQTGFFNKIVSEAAYDKILDICYLVRGFWQTVLKLGTIKINAAGVKLELKDINNVIKINQLLTDLIQQQTGKEFEVKKVKNLNAKEKEQVTEDFLRQEEFEEYDDYDLTELIQEYEEVFGELRFKKLLVDELEKYDEEQAKKEKQNDLELENDDKEIVKNPVRQNKEPVAGNFTKKKL